MKKVIVLILLFIFVIRTSLSWADDPIATTTPNIIHILNRLTFGPSPGDVAMIQQMGIEAFIHQQLYSQMIPESEDLSVKLNAFTTIYQSPAQLFREWGPFTFSKPSSDTKQKEAIDKRNKAQLIVNEAAQARIMRAVESTHQLQEVMVDFWFNHFNIFKEKDWDYYWVGSFEEQAIRPNALGHFSDLLKATAMHPAMMVYLDNWKNTAPSNPRLRNQNFGLNENYAREVMELHTLGVNGGYEQKDVITLARILTGWGVHHYFMNGQMNAFYFNARSHDFSPKIFLGHPIQGHGLSEGLEALDILANSPATAHHISYQLAQYFLNDDPDPDLVNQLSSRFLETKGDIREVLDTLFHSKQFWDPSNFNNKFKTPYQFVISCLRVSGIKIENYTQAVNTIRNMGMPLYGCLTPDGYKNTRQAWLSSYLMLSYLNFAISLANGNFKVTNKPLPQKIVLKADDLLKNLGGQILKRNLEVISRAKPEMQAALILGSPNFVQR